ncbi:DUF882 domain-containing protein [Mesorhizobium denitrificans]|uniref:Murein endopeptidase K n=2 Tax=Phyllobacteriaceae TaxID=69277 RepID=A0A371X8T8_9HYPH|nr:DUF882 domain-containing protein [Mesorhizobium denitrificans]
MAALMASAFISSCASTLDSTLESNGAAFNATAPKDGAVEEVSADGTAASNSLAMAETKEVGDPQLPEQVASLPMTTPNAAGVEAAPAETKAGETAVEAAKPESAKAEVAAIDAESNPAEAAVEPAKPKGLLASFFGAKPAKAAEAKQTPAVKATAELAEQTPAPTQFLENPAPKQILENPAPTATKKDRSIQLASLDLSSQKPMRASAVSFSDDGEGTGLPGVRQSALFEIKRRSGIDDDSDVDVHEDVDGGFEVASAAGMARLAPNGLLKQRENVDVACLKPSLVRVLKTIERRFGKRAVITSGYRSPTYNRSVRGARNSQHMYCAAADVILPGVSKFELASYARSMQGRGGVGTYCHTNAVHIDVGPERDWNWRCRGRR